MPRGKISSSRSASSTAGRCVNPAKMTCSSSRAWRPAPFNFGCECPWMFTHHEEIPSRILRPSSVYRYTPFARADRQRRGRRQHLRIGMPQHGAVAIGEAHAHWKYSRKRPRIQPRGPRRSAAGVSGSKQGISPKTGRPVMFDRRAILRIWHPDHHHSRKGQAAGRAAPRWSAECG